MKTTEPKKPLVIIFDNKIIELLLFCLQLFQGLDILRDCLDADLADLGSLQEQEQMQIRGLVKSKYLIL